MSTETVRELNPELKRWCTPPDYPNYELKIPKGKKAVFHREFAKIPDDQRYAEKAVSVRYRAAKGDTLQSIAQRFGVSQEEIVALNNLKRSGRLRGKVLRLLVKGEPRQTEVVARQAEKSVARPVVAHEKKKAPKAVTHYYTVRRGDTLKSVARRFNVSTGIIAAWNNIKGKMALKPGKRIIVAKFVEKGGKMTPLDGENG